MSQANNKIYYSEKYNDDEFEYRHVHLPKDIASKVPKGRLMTETEWRGIGIQQSQGWAHYMIHGPERHIVLFRRPRTDLPHPSSQSSAVQRPSESFGLRAQNGATSKA